MHPGPKCQADAEYLWQLFKYFTLQDRTKLYDEKVQKAATAVWLAKHRPSTLINVGAANRFISHALPELTPAQKAALKQVQLLQSCNAGLGNQMAVPNVYDCAAGNSCGQGLEQSLQHCSVQQTTPACPCKLWQGQEEGSKEAASL